MYDGERVLDVYMGPVVITNTSERTFTSTTYYIPEIRTVNIRSNELHYIPQMVKQK